MKKATDSKHERREPTYSVPEQMDKLEYFSSLYGHFGKNLSVIKEMLGISKSQIPITLGKLEQCLHDKNYKGFYFEIHRIKSTISIVGLPALCELAMILERDSYDATNIANIPEYFERFKNQAVADMKIIETELEKLSQSVA